MGRTESEMLKGLAGLADQGLGGIVTNVGFEDYLRNNVKWQELIDLLHAAKKLGLRVWIYDEKGYPSGTAGGLILQADPNLEARALNHDGRFVEDRAYEATHASNNYHERRRYINLLDRAPTAKFIEVTHEAYLRHIDPGLWPVEAFFTDEPALNCLNLGTLPPEIDAKLHVVDPPNPDKKILPRVPWSADFTGQIDPNPIFADGPKAGPAKREFYNRLADRVSENYFGQIQTWCHNHKTLSSGHLLWEEDVLFHPMLYGNALRCLLRFDIPGLDVLTSVPDESFRHALRAAILASSAAMLNGTRRVMTEVSDFQQRAFEHRLANVEEMQATAAWQAALGVTDFTLYYAWNRPDPNPFLPDAARKDPLIRSADDYRRYNQFVDDLVKALLPLPLVPDVFLYYPIELVQELTVPSELPASKIPYSPRQIEIRDKFNHTQEQLLLAGIFPCLIDEEMLRSSVRENDTLRIQNARAKTVVFPRACRPRNFTDGVELSPDAPRQLFNAGKIPVLNQNTNVLVRSFPNRSDQTVVCVNLKNETQSCQFQTRSGSHTIPLNPYETKLLQIS